MDVSIKDGINLSFAGCGFLGIYHVGVAVCFKKYAPHLLVKISGASAGALAATCLLCEIPLGEMTSDFFRVINEARSYSLGPFSPKFSVQTCLFKGLEKFLPENAHEYLNGKLHVSLTRVYDGKNIIISRFDSRQDVLQALLCACFIPGFSGILPPRLHGVRYIDGAFSNNLPILDRHTVTVSPFCGETDICPRDDSAKLFYINWANTSIEISMENIRRISRVLFPPKAQILSEMCQQGFDDALQFLYENHLITCSRCSAVRVPITFASKLYAKGTFEIINNFDPECNECKLHTNVALTEHMPDAVLDVFESYIESTNKEIAHWMTEYIGYTILKTLSLPTCTTDLAYFTFEKIFSYYPQKRKKICKKFRRFLKKLGIQIINNILSMPNKLTVKKSFVPKCNRKSFRKRNLKRKFGVNQNKSKDNPDSDLYDDDTFENLLQMTLNHETTYTDYYSEKIKYNMKPTEVEDTANVKESEPQQIK